MPGREDQRGRVSTARRRAEEHVSGYSTTLLKLPEGLSFFELKDGTHYIDVIPYKVKRGKNQKGGNPFADEGDVHYERTFWKYGRIGPEEKDYVAPGKTFGELDYVQEYRQRQSKDPAADADEIKSLNPKERQLFLVYDREAPKKGIQLLEISYHTFGKLLDSRIKNSREIDGWDWFYYTDESGFTLRLTVEERSAGGYKFNEVVAIDFLKRESPLPENIINHGVDLDEMLVRVPYEKLKAIFLGETEEDVKPEDANGQKEERRPMERKVDQPPFDERKSEPAKERTPEPKKIPTAQDAGLSVQAKVRHLPSGKNGMIAKISGDGTSLTVMTDDDEVIRAIAVNEVALVDANAPSAKQDQKPEPKKEPVAVAAPSGKDEDWDKDWS